MSEVYTFPFSPIQSRISGLARFSKERLLPNGWMNLSQTPDFKISSTFIEASSNLYSWDRTTIYTILDGIIKLKTTFKMREIFFLFVMKFPHSVRCNPCNQNYWFEAWWKKLFGTSEQVPDHLCHKVGSIVSASNVCHYIILFVRYWLPWKRYFAIKRGANVNLIQNILITTKWPLPR